jgi:hypothetical protein
MFWRLPWPALFLLPLLVACGQTGATTQQPATSGSGGVEGQAHVATATPFVLPTLLPTQTRGAAPTPEATNTLAPAPSPSPQGTLDFEQAVIELRYRIRALQLDRRLEGKVSGEITVVDETRGVAAIRANQGGVLLELQEVLPTLDMKPLPEECDTCVEFSYSMPLEGAEGEGWLQDPVLLASVENYTAALLGPHFPPGTVLGLRRSATAYDVAHSLALDTDGNLYRWLATSGEIEAPVPVDSLAPQLPALLTAAEEETLAQQYVVSCTSAPFETLYLNAEQDEEGQTILLSCPAFSLPRSLLPLYLQIDSLLQETLEGSGIPRPPSEVALDAVLDYRRDDGAHLEIALDQTATVSSESGETVTTTLSSDDVMSVTTALLESEVLQPGLQVFAAGEAPNVLLVRGTQGMVEAAWEPGEVPQAIANEVEVLDGIVDAGNE